MFPFESYPDEQDREIIKVIRAVRSVQETIVEAERRGAEVGYPVRIELAFVWQGAVLRLEGVSADLNLTTPKPAEHVVLGEAPCSTE